MPATLRITLLGGFRLFCDDTFITALNTPRLQSLVTYLVLHRDGPQPRQHLAFLLWPDSTEAQARTNLRKALHELRQALPDADHFISTDNLMISWRLNAADQIDVVDFEAVVDSGDLAAALDLYRGDLLPSCYDDWILPERERLRQKYLGTLEQAQQRAETRGDYRTAIGYAQRLLCDDALREETYRDLMQLYMTLNDRAGALRVYHACETMLQRELEVEPSLATRDLYRQLLNPIGPASTLAPAQTLISTPPLIGRATHLALLQAEWRQAAAGQARFVLIQGEAGIGKTRLAEELLQWAERQNIATASAHCYAGVGSLAYAPVKEWLRSSPLPPLDGVWLSEVARLLPEVLADHPDVVPPGPLTEGWQRQRLYDALTRALLAQQPRLLLIDNLHWADRDTLDWLCYLLHSEARARLLVIGTLRPEEIAPDHPLNAMLKAMVGHERFALLDLEPLTEADSVALARQVVRQPIDDAWLMRLAHEAEGNPLFIVELARAYQTEQRAVLPQRIHSIIASRLSQLSPAARDVIGVAAVIGRQFTFELLQQASDRPEAEVIGALDEAWQRRLVRERGTSDYDFSHDKLREVAYAQLSAAHQRLLHRRVAEALEALKANDLDTFSAQIATHYERAGENDRAAEFYRRAAETARHVYANQDAIDLYGCALNLSGLSADQLLTLEEGLGDVFRRLGQYDAAHAALDRALQQTAQATTQARLYRKQANNWDAQRQVAKALIAYDHAEAALQTAGERNAAWWSEWIDQRVDRTGALYFANDLPRLQAVIDELRPAIERYASAAQRGRFYGSLVSIGYRVERFQPSDETLTYVYATLEASRAVARPDDVAQALFRVGFCHLWRNELDQAESYFQATAKLDEQTGSALTRVVRLAYQTVLYRKRQQLDRVQRCAQQALAAAESNHILMYVGTAKANLAWLAWRAGQLTEAEQLGNAALQSMHTAPYPMLWLTLWPLLGVALKRDRVDEAIERARAMLDPAQQRLPAEMTSALEQAVAAWDRNEPVSARAYLESALPLAVESGYL